MYGKARAAGAGSSPLSIAVLDLLTNETTIYDSMSTAALALGIKQSTISSYLRRNQKSAYKGRYEFKNRLKVLLQKDPQRQARKKFNISAYRDPPTYRRRRY